MEPNSSDGLSIIFWANHLHRDGPWGEQFNKQTAFIDGSAVYGCHQVGERECKQIIILIKAQALLCVLKINVMGRNLPSNCEVAAGGREVALSPTLSFQTSFQATLMSRCVAIPLTSPLTLWPGTTGLEPRPASPPSRSTSCSSSNNLNF